jgi:hypothetical protein
LAESPGPLDGAEKALDPLVLVAAESSGEEFEKT